MKRNWTIEHYWRWLDLFAILIYLDLTLNQLCWVV